MSPLKEDRTTTLGEQPDTSERQVLAQLTGRRVWLGAVVLLGAHLVPVLLVWGIKQSASTSVFTAHGWVAITLAWTLGLGLVLGLIAWFGGWFQMVTFGEEYQRTFHPLSGYFLGWWRFVVQLAAFIAVIVLAADVGAAVKIDQISSVETRALPAFAERAPIPEGWEFLSDSTTQNEYSDQPNATYSRKLTVPVDLEVGTMLAWLRGPGWAEGVDAMPPFGSLQNIECDAERLNCEAEVKPAADEEVEYTVSVRFLDGITVGQPGDPTYAGLLNFDVEYEEST